MGLSAALHLAGINIHLPSVRFAWPWQTVTAGTTTNTDLGPWVLQKIEGISKPALGEASFNFLFTHKVSKSIGPWPCWYASTFYAVGHASATVDLNPGPAWWTPALGHYRLQVLSLDPPTNCGRSLSGLISARGVSPGESRHGGLAARLGCGLCVIFLVRGREAGGRGGPFAGAVTGVWAGQAAAAGGPQAASNRFIHSCSWCQPSGRCRVISPWPWRAVRAATSMRSRRRVAPRALA